MNTMDTTFSFELAPAELHWLAGAFGITHLPVPTPEGQEKSHLADGLRCLQEQGLVRKSGSNEWQVDSLSFALVHWLASAADLVVLEIRKRSGISSRGYLFKDHGAAMYVTMEKNKYRFMLAPDKETMSTCVMDLLGVSSPEPGSEAANYQFSQPEAIFQVVWTDPAVAANMLRVTGLQLGETESVLAWAGTLEWILSLKQFPLNGGEPERGCQAILCGTVNRCWAAQLDAAASDRVDFIPTDLQETRALLESQF
jgi:hypothetical protein